MNLKDSTYSQAPRIRKPTPFHLAASGNFGQVIKRDFPIIVPDRMDEKPIQPVNLVGPLCTPLDKLGTKLILPKVNINNFTAVLNSGAYGYTASPVAFLGHLAPEEIILK